MIRRRNVWIMLNRIKTKWLTNCPYFKGWKLILLCFLDFRQVKEMRWLLKFRKNALLGTNGGFTTNKYRMKYCWLSTVRQTPSLDSMEWKFWYRQRMDTFCRKQIKLDSTCFLIPGAKVKKQTNTHIHIYIVPFYSSIKINIVFYINHLCVSDDDVHLPDESLLQEYVLNEDGIVYMGEWFDIGRKYWNYGQVLFSNLNFFFK